MPHISEDRHSLFQKYASEFERRYLLEKTGQHHQSLYKKERAEVKQYWAEIKKARQNRKNITDMVFHQPNHNCAPTYKAGQRYLFYASFHKDTKTWEVHGCGRSTSVDRAHDDLRYLERLPEAARQTRISGAIEHYETTPEKGFAHVNDLAGIKVMQVVR
jgi:hypothetical protein